MRAGQLIFSIAVLAAAWASTASLGLASADVQETAVHDRNLQSRCSGNGDCRNATPVCVGGQCVECRRSSQCQKAWKPICKNNVCTPCTRNGQCSDKDTDTPLCKFSGRCVECVDNSDCGGGTPYCVSGVCTECRRDSQCGEDLPKCVRNVCRECRKSSNCQKAWKPICEGNRCRSCSGNSECAARDADTPGCSNGRCEACEDNMCTQGKQCVEGGGCARVADPTGGTCGGSTTNGFDIILNLEGLTPEQEVAFTNAEARWESIIKCAACGPGELTISAGAVSIDGGGGTLAQAGPRGAVVCSDGSTNVIPTDGVMQFDTADLDYIIGTGNFEDVILHEIGHVLGVGTLSQGSGQSFFNRRLCTEGTSTPSCELWVGENCPNALYWFQQISGDTDEPAAIVEVSTSQYGAGSLCSHWDEAKFGRELMTPSLNSGVFNPISEMSIGVLHDLGFVVDYGEADNYNYLVAPIEGEEGPSIKLVNDIMELPVTLRDEEGNVVQ